jgi:hypothetical protein
MSSGAVDETKRTAIELALVVMRDNSPRRCDRCVCVLVSWRRCNRVSGGTSGSWTPRMEASDQDARGLSPVCSWGDHAGVIEEVRLGGLSSRLSGSCRYRVCSSANGCIQRCNRRCLVCPVLAELLYRHGEDRLPYHHSARSRALATAHSQAHAQLGRGTRVHRCPAPELCRPDQPPQRAPCIRVERATTNWTFTW